jgi:hypothetical protein
MPIFEFDAHLNNLSKILKEEAEEEAKKLRHMSRK